MVRRFFIVLVVGLVAVLTIDHFLHRPWPRPREVIYPVGQSHTETHPALRDAPSAEQVRARVEGRETYSGQPVHQYGPSQEEVKRIWDERVAAEEREAKQRGGKPSKSEPEPKPDVPSAAFACGTHRQCYDSALREVKASARIMVEHAHALERIIDRVIARVDPGAMPPDSNARFNEASERLTENLQTMTKHGFWGFAHKSAADMEVQRARLEWCIEGTRAVRGLLLDMARDAPRETRMMSLGAMAVFLPECEAALGIKPQQTRVRAAMAGFVERCPRGAADRRADGDCEWLNVRDERLREARATRNADQQRLPSKD